MTQGTHKADQVKTPVKHRRHRRRVHQDLRLLADQTTTDEMLDDLSAPLDNLSLYPKRKERKNAFDRD